MHGRFRERSAAVENWLLFVDPKGGFIRTAADPLYAEKVAVPVGRGGVIHWLRAGLEDRPLPSANE
jgi:hypothetical protein